MDLLIVASFGVGMSFGALVLGRILYFRERRELSDLKNELNAWKAEAQINEMFLQSIGERIPEEEKETRVEDKDKEPSILKKIWWDVEAALYK